MPGTGLNHPRPACVEDWDDDAQTTLSFTRATANVAVKRSSTGLYADTTQLQYNRDGSDSGYSSRAGTVASASTNGKRPSKLSIDTSLPERERQPYSMTPQARPSTHRESSSRANAIEYVQTPVREKPFRHEPGVCWTCDQYGRHLSNEEHERVTAAHGLRSPVTTKKSSKVDHTPETKLRRMSSIREGRPPMLYHPSSTQPMYAINPVYAPSGYSTPMTPQMPYGVSPTVYTYATPTPVTSTYVPYAGQSDYFAPHPTKEERPANTKRRPSTYGDPVIQQTRNEESRASEKVSSKEARPTVKSHKSSRSTDQQRADREAMPPPPGLPTQRAETASRPSIKKSATYNAAIVDHRQSRGSDDHDSREAKVRHHSPVREVRAPPSSYKHTANTEATAGRPHMQRKSVSYSDPVATTKVATSKPQESPHHPRRNTAPMKQPTTFEQKEAEAEAYQRRSRLTADELTAEKMHELKGSRTTVSSRSETGSAFSHKSHQSSSKASSGRERSHTTGQRTSILLDGGIKLDIPKDYIERTGRPLSMQFGDLKISVGSKDKSSSSTSREQKMIEKAPSIASHASKRSVTNSSHTSSKGKERERDEPVRVSRRSSHVSESRPPVSGSGHSHSQKSSRAPSSTRASVDHGRSRRPSADHDQNRYVYGA